MRLKLIILMAMAWSVQSCQTPRTEAATISEQNVTKNKSVSAPEFKKMLEADSEAILVDVRTAGELSTGKIESAKNIDVRSSKFRAMVAELDKSKTYYVYCRSGGRSKSAANYISSQGINVVNLQGGIIGWQSSGYSVVK